MHARAHTHVCVHTHTLNILPSTISPRIWFLVKFPSVTILIIHPGRIQLSYSTSLERRACFWTQQMSCHTYIKYGWKIIANHLDQSQPVFHCDVTVMCIFWAYSQLSQCKSREISWGNLESTSRFEFSLLPNVLPLSKLCRYPVARASHGILCYATMEVQAEGSCGET